MITHALSPLPFSVADSRKTPCFRRLIAEGMMKINSIGYDAAGRMGVTEPRRLHLQAEIEYESQAAMIHGAMTISIPN